MRHTLFIAFVMSGILSMAQTKQVTYVFSKDTIAVTQGETFSNILVISNNGNRDIVLSLNDNPINAKALIGIDSQIDLEPHQTKYFPIKFLADKSVISKNIQDFTVSFSDKNDKENPSVQDSAQFVVALENVRGLYLDVQSEQIYLRESTNSADLEIRAFNNGLIPLVFKIELEGVPDGLEFRPIQEFITMQPGEQTLIPIQAIYSLKTNRAYDFSVIIRAMDPTGQQIAYKNLRVMSLSSNRNLILREMDMYYTNRPNTLSLNYVNGQSYNSMQLLGTGKYRLDDDREWGYNLNLNHFLGKNRYYTLSDTYLFYNTKKWGVRLGSMYENLNFNVNGKGIKSSFFLGNNRSINVYGLQNDSYIYSTVNQQKNGGHTFAARYIDGIPDSEKTNITILSNVDESSGLVTNLISAKQRLYKDNFHELVLEGGLGNQRLYQDKTNYTGAGMGAKYGYNSYEFRLNSYLYYGSPHYAGLKRGLFQIDNRLQYIIAPNQSVTASISFMNNNPKYLSRQLNEYVMDAGSSSQLTYELGYRHAWSETFNFGVTPYYFQQNIQPSQNRSTEADLIQWNSKSFRTKLFFNYNDLNHRVSLVFDNGYTVQNTSMRPPAPFYSTRINASYQYNSLGITAFYQHNPYYISDALANKNTTDYNVFSIGPNFSMATLKKRMSIYASFMYYYYGYSKTTNYIFNLQSRLNLKNNWAISAQAYFGMNRLKRLTQYDPETGINYREPNINLNDISWYTSRQVSLSVSKKLGTSANYRFVTVSVSCFDDRNNNGIQDKGEESIEGILVTMNGLSAITDAKGKARFTAPSGSMYVPTVLNSDGWSVLSGYSRDVLFDKNKGVMIPLVKTEKISGKLHLEKEIYLDNAPPIGGIPVYAVSADGNQYRTSTNGNGDFYMYLPESSYVISIEDTNKTISIEDNNRYIEVSKGEKTHIEFHSKDKRRRIVVREF